MFEESIRQHGDAIQHVAYWLDESEYDAAAKHLESSGYPLNQGLKLPIARVSYMEQVLDPKKAAREGKDDYS